MAVDAFLKLDGIKGEAQDAKHKDEIDVLSWSWGGTQSGSAHVGGGAGTGKVSVQDLHITKFMDKATTGLWTHLCNGKHIKDGLLTVRKAGEHPLEYLKITLKEVYVSSLSTGGAHGGDALTENLSLNFKEFKIVYTPQNKDGSGGASSEIAWDIARNTKV